MQVPRLRQAWYDSARAMNSIKQFALRHAAGSTDRALRDAVYWQPKALPAPDKPWTVFVYSCMLIAFLDSLAYMIGAALTDSTASRGLLTWEILVLFGLMCFGFRACVYFAILKSR